MSQGMQHVTGPTSEVCVHLFRYTHFHQCKLQGNKDWKSQLTLRQTKIRNTELAATGSMCIMYQLRSDITILYTIAVTPWWRGQAISIRNLPHQPCHPSSVTGSFSECMYMRRSSRASLDPNRASHVREFATHP